MFRKRCVRKDMADVNIYTAKRLNDMAASLGGLARAFSDDIDGGRKLTREDGMAALQAASSMVCGGCRRCNICSDSEKEDSYYLYYLLRTFEQNGALDDEDMPKLFQETCKHKSEYIAYLNRSLGKATMNLSWKNRFLESRDAVIVQFRELAVILEEFSLQMEDAVDITASKEEALRRCFHHRRMAIDNLLVLQYGDGQREAFITVKTTNGRCVTSREAAELVNAAMGGSWCVARDSKNIITRQSGTVRFVEEGKYQMLYGTARVPKEGEEVSGDNFTFKQSMPNQMIMSLSDGMGTGPAAAKDSRHVIELTEQLMETGFSARAALKLVNTVFLLAGTEQRPATLDLCCIDLNTGVLEAMKLGAAATFIIGEDGVELLEAGDVPVGVLNPIEPVLLSKKLWDDDRIVMVSDGVLDALPGENKEQVMREFLETAPIRNPQDMAESILSFSRSFSPVSRDDMTVLTAGIWERK